jgi:hypothetical protein
MRVIGTDSGFVPDAEDVFWLIMTIIASALAVAYLGVGASGGHLRLSADGRALFHRSGMLAIGWAAVCYGHLALQRHH